MTSSWSQLLTTLTIALLGLGAALVLRFPLPFLFGSMLARLAAALAGAPLKELAVGSIAARMVVGVVVGASVTPAFVSQLPAMLPTLALMPLYVLLIGLIGVPFFRRVCDFDPLTAFLRPARSAWTRCAA